MIKNLLVLTLIVFGIGLINISAQTENGVKTISKGVVNGLAISMPKPVYPAAARAVRAAGAVNVEVIIDENGDVISATAVSGHPLLRGSSEQAAQNAKFKPLMLSGEAVKAKGVIVYNFVPPTLENNSGDAGNIPVTGAEISDGNKRPILNGLAIDLVKPEYPAAAKAVRASGTVAIQVTIDENGNTEKAAAISGHPLLRQSAVDAALLSKFNPTLVDGQPVKVEGVIVYNFVP